jgi:predicted RNA-binding protein Jag
VESVYDPHCEVHEFIGDDRAEVVAKAISYFGLESDALAIVDVEPSRLSGLGARVAIVAYPKAAGNPTERARSGGGESARAGGRGEDRGGDGRRRERDRDRGRDRGRDRDRDRGRGRDRDRDREPLRGRGGRGDDPSSAASLAPAEPSEGVATGELSEIGEFVKGLVERMALGNFEISESRDSDELVAIQLGGPGAVALGSGDGRPADAIQLLANQAALRGGGENPPRVVVDVEGEAARRASLLERVAERAAARARESGRPVALEAMNSKDRRTVHVALRDTPGVATMSVGEGRYKQVVVVPESAPEYEEALRYESSAQGDG